MLPSKPSATSSKPLKTFSPYQFRDSIDSTTIDTKPLNTQPNESSNTFNISSIVRSSVPVSHNRSSSVTSKKGVPYLNLREMLVGNVSSPINIDSQLKNKLSSGTVKNSQATTHNCSNGDMFVDSKPQNLNQTAPLHKQIAGVNKSLGSSEQLQEQIVFLEIQNAKYVEKMARMENELALAYSLRESLDNPDAENNYEREDRGDNKKKNKEGKRVKELELQNIKLVENNEYLNEKVNQLENEYNQMKSYLDTNIEQYERLYTIVQDNEDSKENLSRHAKKLADSLKSLNQNYGLLQKKVACLEKENKELAGNLKTSEAEKKNISEKWQKLSKKVRLEGEFLKTTKNLEEEARRYQKEVNEYKEKYLNKDAQLRALREEEKGYKALLENNVETIQNIQQQLDLQCHKNQLLANKNYELVEELTKLQGEYHKAVQGSSTGKRLKTQEEPVETRNSMASLETRLHTLEAENHETLSKLDNSNKEIEHLVQEKKRLEESCQTLKEEVEYANKKWLLLVRDHDQLQKEHKKLVTEHEDENILTEALQQMNYIDDNNSISTARLGGAYDELRDPYAQVLREELLKVMPLSREVYENLERCLGKHLKFVSETTVSKEVEEKYNRLLVKYYKALDKAQALERQVKEQSNKVEQQLQVEGSLLNNTLSKMQKNSSNNNNQRSRVESKNLNNSMTFGKPMQNLTLQDTSQSIKADRSHFQPLQRVMINNRTPSENQREKSGQTRQSRDSSKENMTPNQGIKTAAIPGFQFNLPPSKTPVHLMDTQTHDLRAQLMGAKVVRSVSNGRSVKGEGRCATLSSNEMSTGPSLGNSFTLNISEILRDGENLRKRRMTNERNERPERAERTHSTKNKSYLDMHLSRKGQNQQQQTANTENSFSFVPNF